MAIIRLFFAACQEYEEGKSDITDGYANVYDWMAYGIFKKSRTPSEIRAFAERVYNARKMGKHVEPVPAAQSAQTELPDEENGNNVETTEAFEELDVDFC